jgi:hypothetical protein
MPAETRWEHFQRVGIDSVRSNIAQQFGDRNGWLDTSLPCPFIPHEEWEEKLSRPGGETRRRLGGERGCLREMKWSSSSIQIEFSRHDDQRTIKN